MSADRCPPPVYRQRKSLHTYVLCHSFYCYSLHVLSSHDAKVLNNEYIIKRLQTRRLIILNKSLCEKNLILNISEFPVQKYANKLIKCKIVANSFLVLVFEVLGISSLNTHHPNSLDKILHNAAKGH